MTANGSRRSGGAGWVLVSACPRCGGDSRRCDCETRAAAPGGKPTVRLRMEKRRGKPVTVAAATGLDVATLTSLLKELKAACGAGGTLKDGELEVQGEHRDRVRSLLSGRGYVVKG